MGGVGGAARGGGADLFHVVGGGVLGDVFLRLRGVEGGRSGEEVGLEVARVDVAAELDEHRGDCLEQRPLNHLPLALALHQVEQHRQQPVLDPRVAAHLLPEDLQAALVDGSLLLGGDVGAILRPRIRGGDVYACAAPPHTCTREAPHRQRSCEVVRGRARSCEVVRGRAWVCVGAQGRARAREGGRRARAAGSGCASQTHHVHEDVADHDGGELVLVPLVLQLGQELLVVRGLHLGRHCLQVLRDGLRQPVV